MLRKKLGIMTALALTALSVIAAVGASSASAAFVLKTEECTGGTSIAFCWSEGGLLELSGEETFSGPAAEILLNVPGLVEIDCKKTEFHGNIVQNEPLVKGSTYHITLLELKFKECDVEGGLAAKCEVAANLTTNLLKGTPLNVLTVVFEPESGTSFITINMKDRGTEVCPATVKGLRSITGTQEANYLAPEITGIKEVVKTVEKSGLLFAGQAAELTKGEFEMKLDNLTNLWDISSTS